MKKHNYFIPLILLCIMLCNCNSKDDQLKSFNFTEPTIEYHFTPDSCKNNNWDIRDFKITIPKSFKINKEVTANYLELERGQEYLNFGSASVDLNMALAADFTDKKITIKNSEGYAMYFDAVRGVVDKTVVEVVINNLITYYSRNTNAVLYSKEPKQKITVNNMPASYSGFTLYGDVDKKEIWSHTAVIFVPNQKDFSKSLFAVFTINTEALEVFTADDFPETDSYKIISSITFY